MLLQGEWHYVPLAPTHKCMQGSTDPDQPPSWSFYIHGTFIDQNQLNLGPATSAGSQPLTAASATQQKGGAGADRNWTAAMSSVQIRIEDPSRPDAPADIIRWERNRHVGQHKEQIEIHRCDTVDAFHALINSDSFCTSRGYGTHPHHAFPEVCT